MVFKRLKIHQFFNAVARTFSYTQAWVLEGRQELKNFSKKDVFLVFRGKKKQLSSLLAPCSSDVCLQFRTVPREH